MTRTIMQFAYVWLLFMAHEAGLISGREWWAIAFVFVGLLVTNLIPVRGAP